MSSGDPIHILITLSFPPEMIARLKDVSPRFVITELNARRPEDVPADIWERTEILYTDTVLPSADAVPALRWMQLHYAGVDYALEAPIMRMPGVHVTTLSGAAAPQMAEFVLLMLLALGHRMPEIIANHEKAEWPRDRWDRFNPLELRGSTVGIIGYGSIGREVARLLTPFQVKLLAVKRDAMRPKDEGYCIDGLGDPAGDCFHRLYPFQAIGSMIKECDFVVVTMPLTPETEGLISAEVLKSMKPAAFLIDVGRGSIIDEQALLNVLQERKIAGAALDVFVEEPLPSNSPFWRLPNVLVSPHVAGISARYKERAIDLFVKNLERYVNGEQLLNVFDTERNY